MLSQKLAEADALLDPSQSSKSTGWKGKDRAAAGQSSGGRNSQFLADIRAELAAIRALMEGDIETDEEAV